MTGTCEYCGEKTQVYNVVEPDLFGGPNSTVSVCIECID